MSTAFDYNSLYNSFVLDAEMKNTIEFLNAVKAKTGADSDYALAQKLDTSRQLISLYMQKNKPMGDEMCLKVASILGIDPAIVLSSIHVERAKTESEKVAWLTMFERLGGVAATLVLGIMLNSPNDARANNSKDLQPLHKLNQSIHYTKSRARRRKFNPFQNIINQLLIAH